jgi:TolB-like protein/DNA-binding winged helix-turn-helix (wHTH) protein
MANDLQVGSWRVRPDLYEIACGDERRRLGPKVMGVLLALAERPGEVVGKEELIARVWDGSFTSDEALSAVIYELRRALGDEARSPAYVETIRKGGYRLVAAVAAGAGAGEPRTAEAAPRPRRWSRRRLAWAAAALVAILAVAAVARRALAPAPRPPPPPAVRSVAVLPLFAFNQARSQDLFADGLTEMLTAEIAQLSPLAVTPGLAVRTHAGRWDLAQAVEELGVDAVVEGSVLRSGDRVWVSVDLVDTGSGRMLWSGSYDRRLDDEFSVLRQLAQEISEQVHAALAAPAPASP